MTSIDYIGFDIHKKTISFCAKAQDGTILDEGTIPARRNTLFAWPMPWIGAMEATLFTGWMYDLLKPLAKELKVAHPAMLEAIVASKKKDDKLDARTIADLLRCNLLPECYMASNSTAAACSGWQAERLQSCGSRGTTRADGATRVLAAAAAPGVCLPSGTSPDPAP
jgi:hypothetical protein